jgi:hypothetical protein
MSLRHKSLHGPFYIRHVPMWPTITHLWHSVLELSRTPKGSKMIANTYQANKPIKPLTLRLDRLICLICIGGHFTTLWKQRTCLPTSRIPVTAQTSLQRGTTILQPLHHASLAGPSLETHNREWQWSTSLCSPLPKTHTQASTSI